MRANTTTSKIDENSVSQQFFNEYIEALDPNRLYFTQKDIDHFQRRASTPLYNGLKQGDTEFAFVVYNTLVDKVGKREKFTKSLIEEGFDFTKGENYKFDRKEAAWAKSEEELTTYGEEKSKMTYLPSD